jgi:hypothetical protein
MCMSDGLTCVAPTLPWPFIGYIVGDPRCDTLNKEK